MRISACLFIARKCSRLAQRLTSDLDEAVAESLESAESTPTVTGPPTPTTTSFITTSSIPTPSLSIYEPKFTLYVCTKCTRTADDQDSQSPCRFSNNNAPLADMEDLIPPPKPKSGQVLYNKLLERRKRLANPIQVVPVDCLSACTRGNVVALAGDAKYTYQFGDVDERDEEQVEQVVEFANNWMQSSDGFSKQKTRPRRMRGNCLARVPPLPAYSKADGFCSPTGCQ